jgi:hypothetical protein
MEFTWKLDSLIVQGVYPDAVDFRGYFEGSWGFRPGLGGQEGGKMVEKGELYIECVFFGNFL